MNNQKSKRLNRKQIKRKTIKRKTIKRNTIKRNTIKRKQNKKLAYNQKKLYGGDFNTEEQDILKCLLTVNKNLKFTKKIGLEDVMTNLNSIAHVYSKPSFFIRLQRKILQSNSVKELNDWSQREYNNYRGATDNEDSDDSDVYVYDSDDDDDDDW